MSLIEDMSFMPKFSSRKRVNNKQLRCLLVFMENNVDLAQGVLTENFTQSDRRKKWFDLSKILNAVGSKKTPDQWRRTWNDQKAHVRAKVVRLQKGCTDTGEAVIDDFSDIERRILNVLNISIPNTEILPTEVLSEESNPEVIFGIPFASDPRIPSVSPVTPDPAVTSVLEITPDTTVVTSALEITSDPTVTSVLEITPHPILSNQISEIIPVSKVTSVLETIPSSNSIPTPELLSLESKPVICKTENLENSELLNVQNTEIETSNVVNSNTEEVLQKKAFINKKRRERRKKLNNAIDAAESLRDIIEIQNKALLMIAESSQRQAEEASKQTLMLTDLIKELKCLTKSVKHLAESRT